MTDTGFKGACPERGRRDAENRMVAFNTTAATYTYVGAARVKKVAGATTTVYVFSGSKVIAEYVGGALSKEYVYSGSTLLATIAAGGATTYHHSDHLSTRLETDSTAATTRTFGQFPFGETWYETGTASKWKFTSYERDSESGNDYAIFRSYQNRIGRFSSPDPLAGSVANPQSLNRYAYVANDPVNLVDPLGLLMAIAPMRCDDGTTRWFCPEGGGGGGIWSPNDDRFFNEWMLCTYAGICGREQPLELVGGVGGGGGGGGRAIQRVIRLALSQVKLAKCLNRIFGPGNILNNENLPSLKLVPRSEVEKKTDDWGHNAIATYEVPTAGRGTVLFGQEYFNDARVTDIMRAATYTHEVGNILSVQRFGDPRAKSDPSLNHSDTGANLENCVFGKTYGYLYPDPETK